MTDRLLLSAVFALASCSGGADKAPDPIALVTLASATMSADQERITIYGAAEPAAGGDRDLAPAGEVTVEQIFAPAGTHVARGQPVIAIRPSPTTAADAAKARADAAQAEAALARARRLRADGLVGDAEVETARAAATTAQAARASAGAKSSGALRSPVTGTVAAITTNPGAIVAAGTSIARISAASPARARLGIDPAAAQRVLPGATLQVTPTAGGPSFTVRVTSVDQNADPQTRLASVFADLPAGSGISSGTPLQGEVSIGHPLAAVSIPYAALLAEGGQSYVYVVKGGVAHRRNVETGPQDGDRIAVMKGVRAGEAVVVTGGAGLDEGMKVRTGRLDTRKAGTE